MDRRHELGRFREPFGHIGTEIAGFAKSLSKSFAETPDVPDRSNVMSRADAWALEYWLVLEDSVPIVAAREELEPDVRRQAHDSLGALHAAMPYSEAERGWLLHLYQHADDEMSVEAFPAVIAVQEVQIMDAGVKRIVNGRDLMGRWLAWRRESGQFAGQEGVETARHSLLRLIDIMTPPESSH